MLLLALAFAAMQVVTDEGSLTELVEANPNPSASTIEERIDDAVSAGLLYVPVARFEGETAIADDGSSRQASICALAGARTEFSCRRQATTKRGRRLFSIYFDSVSYSSDTTLADMVKVEGAWVAGGE